MFSGDDLIWQAFLTQHCSFSAPFHGEGCPVFQKKFQTVLFGEGRSRNGFVVLSYFLEKWSLHYSRLFRISGDRKVSVWNNQNYKHPTYTRVRIWLNEDIKIKSQNKKLRYIDSFSSLNVQSQAHDVKYFSLKENEFRNNWKNSLEILVWITRETRIPKYTYF